MPAEDVVLEGAFKINEYRLIFSVEGAMSFPKTVRYGAPICAIADPVRPHHTFSGWSEIPETMPASDVVVTGSFTLNSYPLTLILDGETYFEGEIGYGTDLEALTYVTFDDANVISLALTASAPLYVVVANNGDAVADVTFSISPVLE